MGTTLFQWIIIFRYLRAANIGDEILVQANTVKSGKTLAFLEVTIRNKTTNDVLIKGTHTKFVGEWNGRVRSMMVTVITVLIERI